MDSLLKDVGNCGRFQVMFVLTAYVPRLLFAFFMLFMSFGNHNPGWRCLDNATETNDSFNNSEFQLTNSSEIPYIKGECHLYESCRNVQFNPEASTVITEWNLACDSSWAVSIITSAQMVGVLVGSYITGYMGDKFGRKYTMMGSILADIVLNIITIYSVSWPMFTVLKFFSGVFCAAYRFLPTTYSTEVVSPKWRAPVSSAPYYHFAGIFFAICSMATKDWRQIQIVTAVLSCVCFIAMLWLPRSIRWLVTHNKKKEAFRAAKTIAKINKKPTPSEHTIDNLMTTYDSENRDNKKYTITDLFRPGVKMHSLFISAVYFTAGLTFYVLSFGIKSLPGDLYTNLIIVYSVSFPAAFIAATSANLLGRRKSFITFFTITTVSLFGVVIITFVAADSTENKGVLVLALLARISASAAWSILTMLMNELFPTVIRSTINGWASLNVQIGATIAPFLIPKAPDVLYISYLILGFLNFLCCFFYFLLPETSGMKLQDTWADVAKSSEKTIIVKDRNENNVVEVKHNNVTLLECHQYPLTTGLEP